MTMDDPERLCNAQLTRFQGVGFLPRDAMGFGNDERIEALLQDEAPGERLDARGLFQKTSFVIGI